MLTPDPTVPRGTPMDTTETPTSDRVITIGVLTILAAIAAAVFYPPARPVVGIVAAVTIGPVLVAVLLAVLYIAAAAAAERLRRWAAEPDYRATSLGGKLAQIAACAAGTAVCGFCVYHFVWIPMNTPVPYSAEALARLFGQGLALLAGVALFAAMCAATLAEVLRLLFASLTVKSGPGC